MIPNLKKLGISYSADVNVRDLELENLVCLDQLEKVTLGTHRDIKLESLVYLDQLEKLTLGTHTGRVSFGRRVVFPSFGRRVVFPTTLKKLTLSGKQRSWEDMSIISSLPNLEVLKLRNHACSGYIWETREGEFPLLKFLLISESDLQQWITESSHFPSLKCLVLNFCFGLKQIPYGIGEIPTLELIEVGDIDKSLLGLAKRIQEEQQEYWGNDALQVRCVPWYSLIV